MQPITITKENFDAEVMKSGKPMLLDFWASWCGPCEVLAPTIDEIAESEAYIGVGKVNVDEEPELAAAFGAMSIPLLAVVSDGTVVNQLLGAVPKEAVLKMIEPYKD